MNNPRLRSDGKLAHLWVKGYDMGFTATSKLFNVEMCRDCGVLRSLKQWPETPCKGRVKVKTR